MAWQSPSLRLAGVAAALAFLAFVQWSFPAGQEHGRGPAFIASAEARAVAGTLPHGAVLDLLGALPPAKPRREPLLALPPSRPAEVGKASWYGPGFDGQPTASGEIFEQDALSAAHRSLRLHSVIRVTNLENGPSIVLRVTDRGPYRPGRVLDVSKRAAKRLGFLQQGIARVRIEVLASPRG